MGYEAKEIVKVVPQGVLLVADISGGDRLIEYGQLRSAVDSQFGKAIQNGHKVQFFWGEQLVGMCIPSSEGSFMAERNLDKEQSQKEFITNVPNRTINFEDLQNVVRAFYSASDSRIGGGEARLVLRFEKPESRIRGTIMKI